MRRTLWFVVVVSLLASFPVAAQDLVVIEVLSNRADLISGGDALVRVTMPEGVETVTVDDDGRDVTTAFTEDEPGVLVGLVTGLDDGPNVLRATVPGGAGARVTITNHPIGGPIFAGAQVQPWLCTTAANGLGAPLDAQCNAPTTYTYSYRPVGGSGFQPYDPENPPADVAQTTTDQGKTVPYVVRRERGTADRGIYDIAVLWDTEADLPAAWNHKLFYIFGASCGTIHSQSAPSNVMNDMGLSRGFMVVNSSMNNLGNNCNTIVSAEAAMMLKERVIEAYGPIRYTIGQGCSGGSIGQQMVANAYPGLVDGIQPNCSFMDTWSTGIEVVDCHLLRTYFNTTSPHLWAAAQQRAFVDGHMSPTSCEAWEALFVPVADPKGGCGLPPEEEYPTKPDGCRGSLADYMKHVVGTHPNGFGYLPYDNVGVQYGLSALNSGTITTEQFLDLNEKVGGLDIDFEPTDERRVADPALETLYRSGQINDGRQLDEVAIVDLRGTSNNEIHTDFHTFAMREGLDRANGHHDNHVIWLSHVPLVGDPSWTLQGFLLLDRWLAAAEADTSDAPRAVKIARNKPADAVDTCWVAGRRITDMSVCRPLFPYYGAPRIAAGGPFTHDVGKCALKALDRADYAVTFSDAEWARLQTAFPAGVCDWSKPGIGQVPSQPWMTFAGGPGGQSLGPAPASEPFFP